MNMLPFQSEMVHILIWNLDSLSDFSFLNGVTDLGSLIHAIYMYLKSIKPIKNAVLAAM